MSSLIEEMIPLQRQYEEARFKVEIAIYAAMYTMKPAKTLDDVYHNLEVLRRCTHERIDSEFELAKLSMQYFDTHKRTGLLLVDRSKEDTKYFTAFDPY